MNKTDKKIEEILDRYDVWLKIQNADSSFVEYYATDGLVKELTNLLNTEVQKAVEEAVRELLELEPPAELDPTAYKWWINKYLQTLKDKDE